MASQQCMGRKLDGKQCTRGRKDGTEFCKSHLNKLPFGRIDDDDYCVKEPSKRGRKRKNNVFDLKIFFPKKRSQKVPGSCISC